jgi:hypothetical protein
MSGDELNTYFINGISLETGSGNWDLTAGSGDLVIDTNNITITNTPTVNNSGTEILVRNSGTGNVEYRNVSSIISAATSADTFVTGGTLTGTNLILEKNNDVDASPIDLSGFSGGSGTFTGNTSGDCIQELWVSTISGCSPVVIGPEVNIKGDVTITTSGKTGGAPVFQIIGDAGTLFAVSDGLIGELFAVNNISGLPILQVYSNDTVLMGNSEALSLNSSSKKSINSGTTIIYDIISSAYTSSYYDYNIIGNSSARAGNIMAVWSGNSITYTEYSTSEIGNTSTVGLYVDFSGTNTSLIVTATTNNWVVNTIVRSI